MVVFLIYLSIQIVYYMTFKMSIVAFYLNCIAHIVIMNIYSSQLWKFNSFSSVNKFYIAWRKTVRRIWKINSRTHNVLINKIKRTDSVTAMLDELGWPFLSKRRKDARLILFYKIINNLAQVPHEHILIKAYEGTRKKNNHKFRHIAVNTSQYRRSFFPKTVGPWNQLSFAESPTLENFWINLMSTNRP